MTVLAIAPGKTSCINQRTTHLTVKFKNAIRDPYDPEF
jgi:hypothetical protein